MASRESDRRLREQRLKVVVEGGRLVISIGVNTLAFAVENAPGPPLTTYDYDADVYTHTKVTDPDVFAVEVRAALIGEDETGNSLVNQLFDDAAAKAIEDGCEGVDHGE